MFDGKPLILFAIGLTGAATVGAARESLAGASSSVPGPPLYAIQRGVSTSEACSLAAGRSPRQPAAGDQVLICLSAGERHAVSGNKPAAAPSQCADGYDTVYSRFSDCLESDWNYAIYNSNGEIVGAANGRVTLWNHLSYSTRATWNENIDLLVSSVTGEAVGSSITGPIECVDATAGDCVLTTTTETWKGQTQYLPMTAGADYSGAQSFGSTSTGVTYQTFQVTLTVENPSAPPASAVVGPTQNEQRCDSLSYFPNKGGGCAYYKYPYNFYTLSLSDSSVSQAAQTVQTGQKKISTHAGWYGHGKAITRDASSSDIARNRAKACAGVPPSCDEYPFASTHQGAAFGPYYAASISAAQNSKAGSLLASFYYRNRIADPDPFYARVTS